MSRTVRVHSGQFIDGPHRMPPSQEAVLDMLSAPITRVEWDAIESSGRDAYDWFTRLPREQSVLPEAVLAQRDGDTAARFRVGPNVTVLRYA